MVDLDKYYDIEQESCDHIDDSDDYNYALCGGCAHCDYDSFKCNYYDMPIFMVRRIHKCKHFLDIEPDIFDMSEYYREVD